MTTNPRKALKQALQKHIAGEIAREAIASNSEADSDPDDPPRKRRKRPPAMARAVRVKDATPARLIAYDLETSRIQPGTPRPLYITAFSRNPEFTYEGRIRSIPHLGLILEVYFLTEENYGCKFVAWNGNNFDAYFIAAALINNPRYVLRPYLTKSNSLRGLRITKADSADSKNETWEFLDGIAQLGLVATPLSAFLDKFAPQYRKLSEAINFETEEFDYRNPKHREYAFRDSEGLYYGMLRAQEILIEKFNQPLAVTMGGACIKIFKAHIPEGVRIYTPTPVPLAIIREYVMRGGFCYCVRRYHGPIWKYDINQAYASAMREAQLPHGSIVHTSRGVHQFATIFIARISASNAANRIPFYYRAMRGGKMRSLFAAVQIQNTWLTSVEIAQLAREGWQIKIHESYCWEDTFTMTDYVNKLEAGRMSAQGGPSGSMGTMYKNVGNHSYGKTVEQLEPIEFQLASECPQPVMSDDCPYGWAPYYGDDESPIEHVFYRFTDESRDKDYHQPQIGAFITAHVRMVVRRAALLDPDHWLYADTDCVVFSRDVTNQLDIDPMRYGAWKVEESGTEYRIIAKKVYAEDTIFGEQSGKGLKRSAKGLNVKKLKPADFEQWYEGQPPTQDQVQRQNFLKVMQGAEMYRAQTRRGTSVNIDE